MTTFRANALVIDLATGDAASDRKAPAEIRVAGMSIDVTGDESEAPASLVLVAQPAKGSAPGPPT